jgi:transcriptional regulator with XRE-family HTH domain
MNQLQKNFKLLRERSGLNQAQVSLSLGFSRGAWNNYETGKSKPNLDDFIKISKYFGCSTSDLLENYLSNVHLNKNEVRENEAEYVHLNVHPNVHLNAKKAQKEPCQVCIIKDNLIDQKDQVITLNHKLIASQEVTIQLLQNRIETMEFKRREDLETQYTPKESRKSA